ncbi:hypothetical protein GGR54DRAFT_263895 [Hypoxylon sp. NC1633]|nr:hypothetical protein GGR54DRAFT_263895 [Hypoxylon sp. NC1633]
MTQQPRDIEEGHQGCDRIDPYQQAHTLIRCIRNSIQYHGLTRSTSYPPVSSIPRTSPERLALASPNAPDDASAPSTVLYLAYGSNLSAETFLGVRRIRPISQINVSAPGFDLAFDLPGLPYWEPCFSNATPRKIPKQPLPDPPKPPFPPPPPPPGNLQDVAATVTGDEELPTPMMPLLPAFPPDMPSWSKGMYGVVYEVTREDYAKIIRTEGGGTSYLDVLTPCLALPPSIRIPEKPPIPELPRPFVAHTLYAPQLPSLPDDDDEGSNSNSEEKGKGEGCSDDDDDDKKKKRWWKKLLLPVRRPTPGYAQPSARYLNLIRDGAREHYLPDDYQTYLGRLQAYKITTWRQEVGRWLFLFLVLPLFACIQLLSVVFADEAGRVPRWLGAASVVSLNLVWLAHDKVFRPVFGDGEHTMEEDDDEDGSRGTGMRIKYGVEHRGDEKSALLSDW